MPKHHDMEIRKDGIAVITLDMAEKAANVLGMELVDELDRTIARLAKMTEISGVVIRSGKPKMFIAGANIDEILSLTDPLEAAEKARAGQLLMAGIEKLPVPTIAVIDGPCLGGGLELALACTYRVAGDGSHVRLALPETRLGIIPGFGGTQRLPKVVGLLKAIDLILSGRNLDTKRAFKLGLIDDYTASETLDDLAIEWLRKKKKIRRPAKVRGMAKLMQGNGPLRKIIYSQARKKLLQQTHGFYPAPLAALEVLSQTYQTGAFDGYEIEARKVGEQITTPTCKALINLFLATEEIRREKGGIPPMPIHKVGVIGAGIMGGGIANLIVSKKKSVRLRDIATEPLAKALNIVHDMHRKQLKRKRITPLEAQARMARIAPTLDWTGLKHAELVIEAVIEKMEIKKQVFREFSQRVREEAVLATNTSALSITEIATAATFPERVIGLHFFNPVHRMPLVEIIRGEKTSEATVTTTKAFALEIGKTPIIVADRPGFLVNRILGIYLNEACRMAEEGVSIDLIEKNMKDFGMPMGPFELMDEVGLDVAEKVGLYLADALPHFPKASPLLSAMREDGRLGKKGGKGFYVHGKKGKELDHGYINSVLKALERNEGQNKMYNYEELVDRLILLKVNEASRCLEEEVISCARDVDIGMVMGTGFAPFRGGLLAYANQRGLRAICDGLDEIAQFHGPHFRPTKHLLSRTRGGGKFE